MKKWKPVDASGSKHLRGVHRLFDAGCNDEGAKQLNLAEGPRRCERNKLDPVEVLIVDQQLFPGQAMAQKDSIEETGGNQPASFMKYRKFETGWDHAHRIPLYVKKSLSIIRY